MQRDKIKELMNSRLSVEEIRDVLDSLEIPDVEFKTKSEGARRLVERAEHFNKTGQLMGVLIQLRPDVNWLSAYDSGEKTSGVGNWNIIFSMIENNKLEIKQIKTHVVSIEESLKIEEIRDVLFGRKDLNVRPVREEIKLNRVFFIAILAVQIAGFALMGIIYA